MARGDINQRIGLEGGDDVKNKLREIADTGERLGQSVRRAILGANEPLQGFTKETSVGAVSAKQMHFALQNLTFQVNDVATSLASGISPMRTFAQQGGQIFQAFQQAGGVGPVLEKVGVAVSNLVTPMRLAAVGAAALVVGVLAVAAAAAKMDQDAKQFDIILRGIGKSSQATGKELEEASHRLREVGLSGEEAGRGLTAALREGIKPQDAEKIVRIGNDLNAVLGEGSMDAFIKAAASGGEPLRKFAERLGVIPKGAFEAADALNEVTLGISKQTKAINDALEKRGQSIADERRRLAQQIGDLHRKKGTPEEEAALQSQRRLTEIRRETARQINDIVRQQNEQNRKQLDDFNKKIAKDAQAAADASIVDLIGQRVRGAALEGLSPMHRALLDLRIAWDKLITSLAKSEAIAALVKGMTSLFTITTQLISAGGGFPALAIVVAAFIPLILKMATAIKALVLASGPWGLAIGLVAAAVLLIVENWDTVKQKLGDAGEWIKNQFVGFSEWLAGPLNAGGEFFTSWAQWFKEQWTSVGQLISDTLTSVGTWFSDAFNGTVEFFTAWVAWFGQKFGEAKQFITDWAQWLSDKATVAIAWVEEQVNGLVDWFKGGWQAIQDAFTAVSDWIGQRVNDWLGWFGSLIDKASQVAAAIRTAIGSSSGLDEAAGGGVSLARGGRVWGQGTATSDSILAWLSNGEYVVNAFATKKFLPLLQAINRGFTPRMAAGGRVMMSPIPALAQGGLALPSIGPTIGRSSLRPFNLIIEGQAAFPDLIAPEAIVKKMHKFSRKQSVRSIGKKPGWYGG